MCKPGCEASAGDRGGTLTTDGQAQALCTGPGWPGQGRVMMRAVLCPPNPREVFAAASSVAGRAAQVPPSELHPAWTDSKWTQPDELDGHDSNVAPALLPVKVVPVGGERDVLLLVHQGINRAGSI